MSVHQLRPAAKRADAQSSHIAERKITESGARITQTQRVAVGVRRFPGYTASELADKSTTMTEMQIRRRLSDSASPEVGLIKQGEMRESRITGRREVTWYPRREE